MKKNYYDVVAKIDQIVTREVHLTVAAVSVEDAEAKARAALQVYPEKVEDRDVKSILTARQHYWIPKSVDFVATKESEEKYGK